MLMQPEKKPKVAAFDPGGLTGVCCWDEDFEPYFMYQYTFEPLTDVLPAFDAEFWVVEDYIIDPHVKQGGSRGPAMQVIGVLKAHSRKNGIKMYRQSRSILPIAEKWTGKKMPKNHKDSNPVSAYLHGEYYLQKNGYKKPRVLTEKKNV